ncbi:glycoside hydrolase family 16 protein [Aestuariibaculum sp. M13]|uniref:glycoside hydrolase family 16 protein n=1 Tax=Aestuariibaculum sp. M13 TaxID=2967132 RepID=UPI002159D948|nr:glycoside hydrolase family 16 protein [Aestuariibaculum sp. M13]MCR8668725.1 glycoside hydrolase family 16 protein [Aestuariibaculum sp. M13]
MKLTHQTPKVLAIAILFITGVSCSVVRNKHQEENYQLVFEDHFNGSTYNPAFWSSFESQKHSAPWNHYVVNDEQLAEVKNGYLHMRARWNSKTNLPETGAILTKNKFSFKYGKIEVRAKFSSAGQGGWPAIWLMPQNEVYPGWPHGGEIDIMERLNTDSFVHQVVHQTNGETKHVSTGATPSIKTEDYNTYSVVKLPNRIEFYVNDQLTMVHHPHDEFEEKWPFETDYYIILNHACADKGTSGVNFWPGSVTSTKNFPYEMAVDYVKVWKIKE